MRLLVLMFTIFKFAFSQEYMDAYSLLKSDFVENFDKDLVSQAIEKNRGFAVSSYLALKTASFFAHAGYTEEASVFLNKVDERAILKDDLPFYEYIKYLVQQDKRTENLKRVVVEYPDSYYGYKLFIENQQLFSEDEKVKILETLIKKKMKERATFLLFSLSEPDAIKYIRLLLATNNQEKQDIFSQIEPGSTYYLQSLKHMALYSKEYEKLYLQNIASNKEEYEKAVLMFCERSFYRGEEISQYIEMVSPTSPYYPQLKWFEFLQLYRNGEYQKALEVVQPYHKHYDHDRYNYWLYLVKKKLGEPDAENQLDAIRGREVRDISQISYYRALLDYKAGNRYSFKIPAVKTKDDEVTRLLKSLKKEDYRLAYTESIYLTKTGHCNQVYSALPEVGVRCFDRNSPLTFTKPFGRVDYNENLVYSIIRQESFFDPYAISVSNAVGITQFIPKTATGFAKKLGLENFDMTHLYSPQLAIRFSVEYLKYLDKMWNGNLIYIVASYNAGENAVKRFLENNRIDDPAEFVELFPYKETREYVQKVIRNYIIYNSME